MSALAPPLSRVPVGPAAQRYVIEPTLLGQGRFGKCYLARQALEPRQEFAVKRVPLQASKDQPASVRKRAIENEVSILSCLQHCPEVVRLVEVCHAPDGASVDIVMEHCRGGTLEQWQQGRPLREVEVAAVLQQVLRALAAAHASGIAFGDLKPANILLRQVPAPSEAPQIALADFGCSQRVSAGSRASRSPGTPVFAAPEVFRHLNGMEADLWSCGVLLYHMLQGGTAYPFFSLEEPGLGMAEAYRRICSAAIDFSSPVWLTISPAARELIERMLDRHPDRRITAVEALEHHWFKLASAEAAMVGCAA